jgi:hypothetical protein
MKSAARKEKWMASFVSDDGAPFSQVEIPHLQRTAVLFRGVQIGTWCSESLVGNLLGSASLNGPHNNAGRVAESGLHSLNSTAISVIVKLH